MSYKALFASIALALVWTGAAVWAMRPAAPVPLRYFVIDAGLNSYRLQAHETRQHDDCTVFVRDGLEIAGVCGSHTWSEAVEADESASERKVY